MGDVPTRTCEGRLRQASRGPDCTGPQAIIFGLAASVFLGAFFAKNLSKIGLSLAAGCKRCDRLARGLGLGLATHADLFARGLELGLETGLRRPSPGRRRL